MRILVTGSRHLSMDSKDDCRRVWAALDEVAPHYEPDQHGNTMPLSSVVVVHGACSGADAIAREWAIVNYLPDEPHPADWTAHGKAAGPLRNKLMVDLGADICLAFPSPVSRGTWDCVNKAVAAGIPVNIR